MLSADPGPDDQASLYPTRGVAKISDWGGAWCERSKLHLGVWGLAPSENFKITVYNDRLYSMRDPLQ